MRPRFWRSGVSTESFDQIVDFAGRGAVQVGLHHHREQALIDSAAALQQRRKERPRPQLGDPQLQVSGDSTQRACPRPVALIDPHLGALVRAGANHRGQLRVDQRLIDGLGGLLDPISGIGIAECIQHLQQGRLIQGHRDVPLGSDPWSFHHRDSRDGLLHQDRHAATTYTTPRDVPDDDEADDSCQQLRKFTLPVASQVPLHFLTNDCTCVALVQIW